MKDLYNNIVGFLLRFLIYLEELSYDDLSVLKPIGRFFIKPAWFVRKLYIYLISPIILIWFIIENSKIYSQLKMIFDVYMELYLEYMHLSNK